MTIAAWSLLAYNYFKFTYSLTCRPAAPQSFGGTHWKLISGRSLILDAGSLAIPAEGQKRMPFGLADSTQQHQKRTNKTGVAEAAFSDNISVLIQK